MKKTLLTIVAVTSLVASSFAQTCPVGIAETNPTGMREDFSSTTDPANTNGSGLYPWGGVVATSISRASGNLSFTYSQAQGAYEPMGISFGDDGGSPAVPFTMDVSGNADFSAKFTNNAAYDVTFRIAVQDVNGNTIDTYAAATSDLGGFANAWMYPIQISVAANSTGTISGTFIGGVYADYGATPPAFTSLCDLTKIKGINLTMIQTTNTGAPNYQPLAIVSQSFSVDDISVGICGAASAKSASSKIASSSVYPNPVSDMATVAMELNAVSDVKVTLSDMMGKEMMTITEGNMSSVNANINVANLNKGIYSVNYTINGAAAKSELLMVK